MRRLVVGVLVVAACGDDVAVGPDAETGPPDAEVPGANEVTLLAFDVEHVWYRNGRGAWQVPEQDASGDYVLRVSDDYQVVAACDNDTAFDASLKAGRFLDGSFAVVSCFLGSDDPPPVRAQVSGHMVQAGDVFMDGIATSATAGWDFVLDVEPGTHDLIAVGGTQALIRRNLSITGDTSLPTIDVEAEGAAMVGVPYFLDGVDPDDTVTPEVTWFTGNGYAWISGTAFELIGPPSSLVDANDGLDVFIWAETATTQRSVGTAYEPGQPSYDFTLLPVISGLTWALDGDVMEASWSTLPDHSDLNVILLAGSSAQRVSASRSWIELHGASSLGFDALPPDFDPAWRIDTNAPHTRMFGVFDYAYPLFRSSWVSEDVGAASRRRARAEAELEVVGEHLVVLRGAGVGEEGVAGHEPAAAHRRLARVILGDRVEDLMEEGDPVRAR